MKINGKTLAGMKPVLIPIIRGDETIMLQAKPVTDWDEFDEICPTPKPPMMKKSGETIAVPDLKDKEYNKAVVEYGQRRVDYMIIKSLEATEELEWDTVDLKDPTTYKNYEQDFKAAGLTSFEINRIVDEVMSVNGLNDEMVEEAKKRFLEQAREAEEHKDTTLVEEG